MSKLQFMQPHKFTYDVTVDEHKVSVLFFCF